MDMMDSEHIDETVVNDRGASLGLLDTGPVSAPLGAAVPETEESTIAGGVVRYNAVWEPGTDGRPSVHGWTKEHLLQRNGELSNQGWRIAHVSTYALSASQRRYDAIWKPGSERSPIVLGFTEEQFWAENEFFWNQGLRLHMMNRYLDSGTRFAAIWKPGSDSRQFVFDRSLTDFRAEDARMRASGYRLIQVSGQFNETTERISYDGIWTPGSDARPALFKANLDEWNQANGNHWNEGYRIKYIHQYPVHFATCYDVIWQPGTDGRPVIYGWTYDGFAAKNAEFWAAGYRLSLVQPYLSRS